MNITKTDRKSLQQPTAAKKDLKNSQLKYKKTKLIDTLKNTSTRTLYEYSPAITKNTKKKLDTRKLLNLRKCAV